MTTVVPSDEAWSAYAACASQDLRLFFRPSTAAAQAICRRCRVRAECLHDALVSDAPNGVWGGLTRQERRALPPLPAGRGNAISALRDLLAVHIQEPEPVKQEPAAAPTKRSKATKPKPVAKAKAKAAEPRPADRTELKEKIAALLRQGATHQRIITELHVSSVTVAAVRQEYGIPHPVGSGHRLPPVKRGEVERRTVELLREGATYREVTAEVGISAPTIVAIRRKAGLPSPDRTRRTPPPRSITDALAENVEAYGDGHARWTGPMTGRMPQLHAEAKRFNARHIAFEEHHGRPPIGYVRSNCGEQACIAGAHLTDDQMRNACPEEPVTIQALRDLLDEIDTQGGPQAARDNRLRLPDEEPVMATAPDPRPAAPAPAVRAVPDVPAAPAGAGPDRRPSENLPIGKLLTWAEGHADAEVQATAQRTRAGLVGLRNRYDADRELAALGTEAEQLEQRLAELRARQQELAPPKAKTKARKSAPLGYDSATVRAWARDNGVDCPVTGRVPNAVVDQWKAATAAAAGGAS